MKKYFTLFILLFSFCFVKTVNASTEYFDVSKYVTYWSYHGPVKELVISSIPVPTETNGYTDFMVSNGWVIEKEYDTNSLIRLHFTDFPKKTGTVSFAVGVRGIEIGAVSITSGGGHCSVSTATTPVAGDNNNDINLLWIFYNVTCTDISLGGGDNFIFHVSTISYISSVAQMKIQSLWQFSTDEQSDTNKKLDNIDKNQQETNKKLDESNKKQDETNKKLGDLNDTLNDNNVDSTSSNSFFGNFNDDDHGLSSIITAPLSFIKNLTSQSCTPINFKLPFVDNTFQFPCFSIYYNKHFGTVFTLYQTIIFGIVSYYICIQIYGLVKGFKDPDNDRIEVLEL